MEQGYLGTIRKRLQTGPLPGHAAQQEMSHAMHKERPIPIDDNYRRAAVMALFYPGLEDELTIAFILRSSRDPRDRHAGQIAFPGGSVDPDDENLAYTALRETEEEIGVPKEEIELLGELTDLYIPVSNFLVTPFVGWLDKQPDFVPQESEVAAILEIPFADFLKGDARQKTSMKLSNGMTLKNVPYWNVGGHKIWGATSMMMSEVVGLTK